jgi:hypothetical protein
MYGPSPLSMYAPQASWAYYAPSTASVTGNPVNTTNSRSDGRLSPGAFGQHVAVESSTNMAQLQGGYVFSPAFWDRSSGQLVQIGNAAGMGMPPGQANMPPTMGIMPGYRFVQPTMMQAPAQQQQSQSQRRDSLDYPGARRSQQFFTPIGPISMGSIAGSPNHLSMMGPGSPPPLYSPNDLLISPPYTQSHMQQQQHPPFINKSSQYHPHRNGTNNNAYAPSNSSSSSMASSGLYDRTQQIASQTGAAQRSRLLEDFRNNRLVLATLSN